MFESNPAAARLQNATTNYVAIALTGNLEEGLTVYEPASVWSEHTVQR